MTRKTILIALLALVFAAPVIAAKKPAPASKKPDFSMPKLKFESVEEPSSDFVRWLIYSNPSAKYIARFALDPSGPFRDTHTSYPVHGGTRRARIGLIHNIREMILSTPTGKKLSLKQKELLSQRFAIIETQPNQKPRPIYVLGVDKEQAQNTAIAFLEYLTESAEEGYRAQEKRMRDREKQHQELSKESEAYPEKIKATEEKFDKIKRQTHYQNVEAASKAIERMNIIVESESIKETVLHAKEKALVQALDTEEAIKAENPVEGILRQPIFLRLEELRLDLRINRAEVEATLMAASAIRHEAELFNKYQRELIVIAGVYDDIRKKTDKAHRSLLSQKERMANPPKDMLPPKVIDNTVELVPVELVPVAVEHEEVGYDEEDDEF